MNPSNVPERWFDTLEMPEIVEWLSDKNFPYDNAYHMVSYLKRKRAAGFERVVLDTSQVPQSFVHWWCHMRVARRTGLRVPEYTHMQKWLPRITKWKKGPARPEDVIGTFKVWLDILFLDISMYEDEFKRPNVPRRAGDDDIQWDEDGALAEYTRVETVQYVMNQGLAIFKERGWKDGASYWKRECKKYFTLFS